MTDITNTVDTANILYDILLKQKDTNGNIKLLMISVNSKSKIPCDIWTGIGCKKLSLKHIQNIFYNEHVRMTKRKISIKREYINDDKLWLVYKQK
jgi:hypothetical protein